MAPSTHRKLPVAHKIGHRIQRTTCSMHSGRRLFEEGQCRPRGSGPEMQGLDHEHAERIISIGSERSASLIARALVEGNGFGLPHARLKNEAKDPPVRAFALQ